MIPEDRFLPGTLLKICPMVQWKTSGVDVKPKGSLLKEWEVPYLATGKSPKLNPLGGHLCWGSIHTCTLSLTFIRSGPILWTFSMRSSSSSCGSSIWMKFLLKLVVEEEEEVWIFVKFLHSLTSPNRMVAFKPRRDASLSSVTTNCSSWLV